jgi:pimeloyl-ACP methyl ester carboxylesterase
MMTPPKAAQGALAALRNARAETIRDAGHNMTSEAPDAVLSALWKFANAS